MVKIAIVHFRWALLGLMPAHKWSDVIVVICSIIIVPRHFFLLLAYNISVAPQGLSNDEIKRFISIKKQGPAGK